MSAESGWNRNAGKTGGQDRVDKMWNDLYYGNGKAGITVRMELMEQWQKDMKYAFRKISWLLIGTFLTSIATIIVILVTRH
jgi:hypothetical protein